MNLYFNQVQTIQMIMFTFLSMIPLMVFVYFDKKDDGAWLGFPVYKIIKWLRKKF